MVIKIATQQRLLKINQREGEKEKKEKRKREKEKKEKEKKKEKKEKKDLNTSICIHYINNSICIKRKSSLNIKFIVRFSVVG